MEQRKRLLILALAVLQLTSSSPPNLSKAASWLDS